MFNSRKSSMALPIHCSNDCMSASRKCYKYLRRMLKFDQMDFEFAFWQMLYLLINPQKVYRNFQYRKQTKSQFARDDPAFLVLFVTWLCLTSVGFAVVLRLSFLQFFNFLLWVVFVDYLTIGMIIATFMWMLLNKLFRRHLDQDVEWGYAFDVHLNAFCPPITLLHFCQLFFYNGLISHEWFLSRLLGNTFWLVAMCYYIYITFLGYSSLHFLERVEIFLWLIPVVVVAFIVSLAGGYNITYILMTFYRDRVA